MAQKVARIKEELSLEYRQAMIDYRDGAFTLMPQMRQLNWTDPANPVEGHTGDENSGDADGNVFWFADVAEGTSLAQWTLDSSDDAGSDLDLIVYRVVSREDTRYYEQFVSATASAGRAADASGPVRATRARTSSRSGCRDP